MDSDLPAELPESLATAFRRRRWLLGSTGLFAAMACLGYAWWRQAVRPVSCEPLLGFWAMQWDSPKGGIVRASSFRDQPLLINFWATWCPPCIEELPLIDTFYRENRTHGWGVLALAVDRLVPVQSFLAANAFDFPVGMATLSGIELGRSLGNLSGGLPFSVVIGKDGMVLQRKMGRLKADELQLWSRLK